MSFLPTLQPITKHARKTAVKAIALFLVLSFILSFGARVPPTIEAVRISDQINDDQTVALTIEVRGSNFTRSGGLWCYFGTEQNVDDIPADAWIPVVNGECRLVTEAGNYYLYAKDAFGNVTIPDPEVLGLKRVISLQLDRNELVLPHDGQYTLSAEMLVLGEVEQALTWTSSDEAVATVKDGVVTGIDNGVATITAATADGKEATAAVTVTDLYHTPQLEFGKPKLPAYYYSEADNDILDAALAFQVDAAGYGTRAGAVAAARFLTLEFPWRLHYFYENGRMNPHGQKRMVDGEGRYYHKGLYLHESRYKNIAASLAGPAIWGTPLTNYENAGYFVSGQQYPNGLSCSGFISWVLLNGGMEDIGDVGAGDYLERDDDLCDLGTREWNTVELMLSGRVRVGDLIGRDGHIAIIVGMDDTYIYIAESLGAGVAIEQRTLNGGVQADFNYDYVMLMDSVYNGDGNFTEMWD